MHTESSTSTSTSTRTSTNTDADLNSVTEREGVSQQHAEQLRAFQGHAGGFIVGMAAMFGVNLVTNLAVGTAGSWSAWWSLWALIGWSAGVAIHGLVVWLNRPLLPAGDAVWGES